MTDSQLPLVTFEDLQAFQAKHFPNSTQITSPEYSHSQTVNDEYYEEDDGLGYYPDGVKRTLTDEQIEIFRHSEIHALLRERELREEALAEELREIEAEKRAEQDVPASKNGGVSSVSNQETGISQKENGAGEFRQHGIHEASRNQSGKARPDEPLDYNDEGANPKETHSNAQFTGRRIISYDD